MDKTASPERYRDREGVHGRKRKSRSIVKVRNGKTHKQQRKD